MKRTIRIALQSRSGLLSSVPISRQPRFHRHPPAPGGLWSRTSSLLSRNQGLVDIQRVAVSQRRFTWKKVITTCLATGLGIGWGLLALDYLLIDDEEEDEDGADVSLVAEKLEDVSRGDRIGAELNPGAGLTDKGPEKHTAAVDGTKEEEEEEEDDNDYIPDETPENAWFFPLGIIQELPRVFYKQSDPEWQEYVKFNRDNERQQRVIKEVIEGAGKTLNQHKDYQKLLGKNGKCERQLLTFVYPRSPPPEYQQLGLEICPEYIAILHRRRDFNHVRKLQTALWPQAVASSAYATLQDGFGRHFARVRAMIFGTHEADNNALPLNVHVSMQAGTSTGPPSSVRTPAQVSTGTSDADSNKTWLERVKLMPGLPQTDQDIDPSIKLFKRNLSRRWRPAPTSIAGAIYLKGTLEFAGHNGSCTFEIVVMYSAMEDKIKAMQMRPLVPQPRNLIPRG